MSFENWNRLLQKAADIRKREREENRQNSKRHGKHISKQRDKGIYDISGSTDTFSSRETRDR